MAISEDGFTKYSKRIDGEASNYNAEVRYDLTDGTLGISQFDGEGVGVVDRVLLSPKQVSALIAFLKGEGK